jgi:hypothetical protein
MRPTANDRATPRSARVVAAPRAVDREPPTPADDRRAEEELLLAFAPVYKGAFGVAMGIGGALLIFVLTFITLLREPSERFPLELLNEYLYGYRVSWPGLVIGTAWGFVVGFVTGWFIAFCRNLAVAISVFAIRTRAELTETRDFLDHI